MFQKFRALPLYVSMFFLMITLTASGQSENLFDQISELIQRHYYGFTSANIDKEISLARQSLANKCKDTSLCTFDTAIEVATDMLKRFSDAHTYLVSKQQLENEYVIKNESTSKFRKLGVIIDTNTVSKDLFIVDVYANSLALKYQLKAGDRIIKINQKASSDFDSAADFFSYFRQINSSGKELLLKILRLDVEFEIRIAETESSFSERAYLSQSEKTYPILKIQGFLNGNIPFQVHSIINQLERSKSKNLIIDLRYNTGGNGSALVGVLSAFLKNPTLAYTSKSQIDNIFFKWLDGGVRYTEGGSTKTLVSISDPAFWTGCPPIVIVNDLTASAAETLALTLQAKLGSKIIGEPTTGIANTTGTRVNLINGDVLSMSYYRVGEKPSTWYQSRVIPTQLVSNDLYFIGTPHDPMIVEATKISCKK
jgi:C-terminal processing protease CtpA/Prc